MTNLLDLALLKRRAVQRATENALRISAALELQPKSPCLLAQAAVIAPIMRAMYTKSFWKRNQAAAIVAELMKG